MSVKFCANYNGVKKEEIDSEKKIDVLEIAEKEKLSVRYLAERFKVGKTQISEIWKDED